MSLKRSDGQIRVRVQDWGRGFDPDAARQAERGFGLVALEERARLLGGSCRVDSSPGGGTVIEAVLPTT